MDYLFAKMTPHSMSMQDKQILLMKKIPDGDLEGAEEQQGGKDKV